MASKQYIVDIIKIVARVLCFFFNKEKQKKEKKKKDQQEGATPESNP